jgi:hypothetical protein
MSDTLPFLFELQKTKFEVLKTNDIEFARNVATVLIDHVVSIETNHINQHDQILSIQIETTLVTERIESCISSLESSQSKRLFSLPAFALIITLVFGLPITAIISYNIGVNSVSHFQTNQP